MSDKPEETTIVEPSLVDGLLSEYGTDVETFDVTLPKGEVLTFRQLRSYGELGRFNRDAAEFAVKVTTKKSQVPEAWWPYLPDDKDSAIAAYTLHALSVAPRFEQIDALRMLRAPWLVSHLMKALNARRMNYLAESFHEGVEEGKGESGGTESSASD